MNQKKNRSKILLIFFAMLFAKSSFAQITPAAMQQIQLLLNEKNSRTPSQRKIDSHLLQAVREKRGEVMAAGVTLAPANVNADASGALLVDINADITPAFLSKITLLGGKIIFASAQYHTVRASLNLSEVETVSGYSEVKFIQPAVKATLVDAGNKFTKTPSYEARVAKIRTQLTAYLNSQKPLTGSVTSQGDAAHGANTVRSTYGYQGQGIKIGVLSDSYNSLGGAAADVASDDLPGTGNPNGNTTPVTVVEDIVGGSDEGRAMLQVVHDLAPKATLYFATAFVSEADFATNIQTLRNTYNCNIIIDDVSYADEPVFQDGIVAQAVDAVTAAGALYFSSAGNSGSLAKGTSGVFEGDFNDAGSLPFSIAPPSPEPNAGTIHNFGTVSSPVNGDIITVPGEAYSLTWSDPWGASTNDYDLFLVSSAGVIRAYSTNVQATTLTPFEYIGGGTIYSGDRLIVFKASGAAVRAMHLNTNRGELTVATNGQTSGHACAINAFCMAATPAAGAFTTGYPTGPYPSVFVSTDKVEPFSSDGPRRIFYTPTGTAITSGNFLFGTGGGTLLAKPDLTAADGVSTTLPSTSGLNPFFGTSCAAPHAGAIAALLLSANPALTTTQIRTILTSTALDIEGAGYDNNSGNGIIQAVQAAQQAVAATPIVPTPPCITGSVIPISITNFKTTGTYTVSYVGGTGSTDFLTEGAYVANASGIIDVPTKAGAIAGAVGNYNLVYTNASLVASAAAAFTASVAIWPTVDKGTYCITGSSVNITITNPQTTGNYKLVYWNVGQVGYSDFLDDGYYIPNAAGVITVNVNPSVATSTSTGAYQLFYNSPICGLPPSGSPDFASFTVGTTPSSISIGGTTNCLSVYSNTTLTASQTLCGTCNYAWTSTGGTFSGQTGSTVAYRTNGQLATVTATYNVGAGCSVSSVPTTMVPSVPTITLPSCVGNAPGSVAAITINNYYPASGNTYSLTWENVGDPRYTDFLTHPTSISPVLSGGSWVINVPVNTASCTNGTLGVYFINNVTCGSSTGTQTIGETPPYILSLNTTTHTLEAPATYSPYSWYNCTLGTTLTGTSNQYTLSSISSGANDYFSAETTISGCTYRASYLVPNYVARPEIVEDSVIAESNDLIKVYPNPNQGSFFIDIQKVVTKASANLYDYTGKLVRELTLAQGINSVNDVQLASGQYSLIIMVDGESYPNKILIVK
jgi:hypothetical protein